MRRHCAFRFAGVAAARGGRHVLSRLCVTRSDGARMARRWGYARTSLAVHTPPVTTRVACERAVRERAHHTPLRGGALGVVLNRWRASLRSSASATASTATKRRSSALGGAHHDAKTCRSGGERGTGTSLRTSGVRDRATKNVPDRSDDQAPSMRGTRPSRCLSDRLSDGLLQRRRIHPATLRSIVI